ncbi:MAG: hypothetical protein ISR69_07980 [Gammaproteobacteria bacterium]|nr:hypothetical protein [Gammaproteobacteria bacterium]
MRFSLRLQTDFCLSCLLFLIIGANSVSAQSNNDYLNALDGEASDLKLDNQTKSKKEKAYNPIPQNSANSLGSSVADGLPADLSLDDFIATIKSNYFGTYIFMKRLSSEQKFEVYNFYLTNNDPQAIRSQVLIISKKN